MASYKLRVHTKKNAPISTWIKKFTNKRSGKVAEARDVLQWRFYAQDWKCQKRIIFAFLDGSKRDRQWAYLRAMEYWDPIFEPRIRELWEQYHEERSSWPLIRHCSEEFLLQNIDKFTAPRDYFFICMRLAKDKDFVIDKARLSFTDYLAVKLHTGRNISDDEALDILFRIVHSCCVGDYYKKDCGFNLEKIEKGDLATPINFTPVDSAIYYLKKLNCETAVSEFEKWNETVKDTILNSSDFKQINQPDYEYYFYKFGLYSVVEKYAYHALDDKYKSASDRNVDDLIYAPVFFLKNMKYKWEEFSKVKECILP